MTREKLRQITLELVSDTANYSEMKVAADQLYELFSESSGFKDEGAGNKDCVFTPNGKAISPFEAGHCVKEFMRTRQFIKGFELAIKAAKSKFKGETIKILYAGTGPFATLMLPITTIFSSEEIQFTLIEINEVSVQHLEQVIDQFQARPYVMEIIQADAATYKLTNKGEHHILITETMQRALKKEPQVGITLNLLPQIHKDGFLIPESIHVNLALVDSSRDMARMTGDEEAEKDYYLKLGNIIEFDKPTALAIANEQKEGRVTNCFECAQIEFPENVETRFKHLKMMTEIQVYKEITLTHNQCSLNLYEPVKLNSDLGTFPKVLSFEYELSDMPKIKWHA